MTVRPTPSTSGIQAETSAASHRSVPMIKFKNADPAKFDGIFEYDMVSQSYAKLGEEVWLHWPARDFADALTSGEYVIVTEKV